MSGKIEQWTGYYKYWVKNPEDFVTWDSLPEPAKSKWRKGCLERGKHYCNGVADVLSCCPISHNPDFPETDCTCGFTWAKSLQGNLFETSKEDLS